MKKTMVGFAVAVAAALLLQQPLAAGDKASTSELPAALQALGVDNSRILSTDEAEVVRGEALTGIIIFTVTGTGFTSTTSVGFVGVTAITVQASPTPQTLFGVTNSNAVLLIQ